MGTARTGSTRTNGVNAGRARREDKRHLQGLGTSVADIKMPLLLGRLVPRRRGQVSQPADVSALYPLLWDPTRYPH